MTRLDVAAAVIEDEGRFLLTRRIDGTHLAGHWEFPGGKREPGESLEQCLVREIEEELGVTVAVGALLHATEHRYDTRVVALYFFACRLTGTPQPQLGQAMEWVSRAALRERPFPEADASLIDLLVARDPGDDGG